MLARLIDSIVLYIYMMCMVVQVEELINYFDISDDFLRLSFVFILFAPFLFYSLLCEWLFNGQSIGKRCMGLRVVMVDGDTLTLGAILMRWMMLLVDFYACLMGVLFIAFTRRHQRIGDLAAGTMVIRKPSAKRMHLNIDEFFYASPDYKPTFPEAQNLSLEQADIIQNVLYSNVMYDDEQVALLAKKVEKVLDVVNKQPSDVAFLTTVLHDYQYYALRII